MQARYERTAPQARRRQPETGAADRRRVAAAALSAIVPGLGQAANGRRTLAIRLAVPSLVVGALALLIVVTSRPAALLATLIEPTILTALLVLNVLVLVWRLIAVGQAFFDRRYAGPMGRGAVTGLAVVVAFVALPHLVGGYYGYVAMNTFNQIFDPHDRDAQDGQNGLASNGPTPLPNEQINVLLMGIDSGAGRAHALTDTLIVVSIDPVGKTVSMVSIPRDMVDVPLGSGNTFAPKINSLLSYAGRHPGEFANTAPTRVLEDAIGALLGIPIHYYAKVDLAGFVKVVDAVGGVDITVKTALYDPNYGGYGFKPGTRIEVGRQHMDGATALAYARIRKSAGESDFTRAARQQEVLVAIRDAAVRNNLLFSLPSLLDALAKTIQTDLPRSQPAPARRAR